MLTARCLLMDSSIWQWSRPATDLTVTCPMSGSGEGMDADAPSAREPDVKRKNSPRNSVSVYLTTAGVALRLAILRHRSMTGSMASDSHRSFGPCLVAALQLKTAGIECSGVSAE